MLFSRKNFKAGFTLIELLVTITIFVILTGVVLFSQSKFNSTILLTNLAYDTALTIRQAQTYGINIKEFSSGAGSGEFLPYGVHFDTTTDANKKSFILFANIGYSQEDPSSLSGFSGDTSSCQIDKGCVNRYTIKRGNFIEKLCVSTNVITECEQVVQKLDILFRRPNPDAIFCSANSCNQGYSSATIFLKNPDGNTRKVRVQSNGLIEIVNE